MHNWIVNCTRRACESINWRKKLVGRLSLRVLIWTALFTRLAHTCWLADLKMATSSLHIGNGTCDDIDGGPKHEICDLSRCHIAFMVVESALIGVWGEFLVVNAHSIRWVNPSAVRTKLLSWSEVDFVAHTTANSLYFFMSSSFLTRCLTHINAIIN